MTQAARLDHRRAGPLTSLPRDSLLQLRPRMAGAKAPWGGPSARRVSNSIYLC